MNAITSQTHKAAQKDLVEASLARYGKVVNPLRTAFPKSLAIYAFGSRINGTAQANSDLDLAIQVSVYADHLQLWEVANLLTKSVALWTCSTCVPHQRSYNINSANWLPLMGTRTRRRLV